MLVPNVAQVMLRMALSADYCSNLENSENETSFSSGIFVASLAHGHPQITGGRATHKSAAAALKNAPRAVVVQSPFGKKANAQDAMLVLTQMIRDEAIVAAGGEKKDDVRDAPSIGFRV